MSGFWKKLFGARDAESNGSGRCRMCQADLSDQTVGKEVKQYRDLCDACATKEYEAGHSVQDMKLKDGSTAKMVKYVPVERAKVESLDISDVEEIVKIATEELQRTGAYQPWNMTISGYESDPRELLEIPEVRAWCKKCLDEKPYLLALLSQDTINWFVFCVVNVKVVRKAGGKMEIDMKLPDEDIQMLVANGIVAWNFFASCGVENTKAGKMSQQAQRRLPWFKDMPEF